MCGSHILKLYLTEHYFIVASREYECSASMNKYVKSKVTNKLTWNPIVA